MPSITKTFSQSAGSDWSVHSGDGITGTDTGEVSSSTSNAILTLTIGSLDYFGLIPSTATITGVKFYISARESGGNASLRITPIRTAPLPASTGTQSSPFSLQTFNTSFTYGGENDLLGLSNFTPSTFQNLEIQIEKDSSSNQAIISKLTATGNPRWQVYYTLPFSNKVYNTSGKLSITSGKVSIT